MSVNPQPPAQPDYVVLHDAVGGVYTKGDTIPPGTYSEEQLARLVGLGAIQAIDPPGLAVADPVEPSVPLNEPRAGEQAPAPPSPAAQAPTSAEEFKARQDAAATGAASEGAGGSLEGADLTDAQREALAAAGFTTAADVRAASDEQLLAVEGIGPAAVKKLREATA